MMQLSTTTFREKLTYCHILCSNQCFKVEEAHRRMNQKRLILRSFRCFFLLVLTFSSLSKANPDSQTSDEYACNNSISECREKDELLMESEISQRFLEQRRYISVGALKRDKPVCDAGAGGESYTQSGGCLPPPANPVSRGCSKYYRCRSDS